VASDRRALYATGIYHLTNDGAVTVMAGEITLIQAGLGGFGLANVGILTAVALGTTAVFQILFGRMADARDPARLLPLGIAWLGFGTILVTQANAFPAFLGLVAVSRVGAAMYHPVGISLVGREYGGANLDRSMGFQSSLGDVGVILGMATSGVIGVASQDWRAAFAAWGAVNIAAVGVGLALIRGRPRVPRRTLPKANYRTIFRTVRRWALPLAIGGAAFTIVTTYGTILLRSNRFSIPLPAGLAAIVIAAWIGVGSVMAFAFGRISRRFGRFRVLLVAYGGLVLTGLVAGGIAGPVGLVATILTLWTAGALLFVTYPALFSFVSETSHPRSQGAAFGVIFGFQLVGGALLGWVAGWLAELLGANPAVPFLVMAGAAAAGVGYLVAIRARVVEPPHPVEAPVVSP